MACRGVWIEGNSRVGQWGALPLAGATPPSWPQITDSNVTTAATTKKPATSDDRSMVMMLGNRERPCGTWDKKVIGIYH